MRRKNLILLLFLLLIASGLATSWLLTTGDPPAPAPVALALPEDAVAGQPGAEFHSGHIGHASSPEEASRSGPKTEATEELAAEPEEPLPKHKSATIKFGGIVTDYRGRGYGGAAVFAMLHLGPEPGKVAGTNLAMVCITDDAGHFNGTYTATVPVETTSVSVSLRTGAPGAVWDEMESSVQIFTLRDGEARMDIRLELPRRTSVSGRVVDEQGQPVANAMVTLTYLASPGVSAQPVVLTRTVQTNPDGEFLHEGPADTEYRIYASASGLHSDAESAVVRSSAATDTPLAAEIVLRPAAKLCVTPLVDAAKYLNKYFRINVYGPDGQPSQGRDGLIAHLAADGSLLFTSLPSGTMTFELVSEIIAGSGGNKNVYGPLRSERITVHLEPGATHNLGAVAMKPPLDLDERPPRPAVPNRK